MRIPKSICAITSACDPMASRYALSGVLFGREDKKPFAVASDGRRMIHATWDEGVLAGFGDEPPASGKGTQLLVEASTVRELAGICNGAREIGDKRFYLDETSTQVIARFSQKGTKRTVESEAVIGKFPRWQDVMRLPEPVAAADMGGALLLDTLKAVVKALECKGNASVKLEIMPSGVVRLSGENEGKTVTAVIASLAPSK